MSTIAEIGFWPRAIILSFSHFGLLLFFTPEIRQLPNIIQPWFFSFKIFTGIFWLPINFIFLEFNFFSLPMPDVAKSLAIPLTPKQSGLFGVIEISMTFWLKLLKYFLPIRFL